MQESRSGFTIVELLIVIIIIGILSSIAIVGYDGIQGRAAKVAATSDVVNAIKKIEALRITGTDEYPTAIDVCPTPAETELCLSASAGGEWLYATSSAIREPDAAIASINSRQFKLVTRGEMYSTNEFLRTLDLAPIIDKYGLVEYKLEFDIKSADSSSDNTTTAYMQNGSGAKYNFSKPMTVTNNYQHMSFTLTPTNGSSSMTESWLAFYGTYGTGNIPIVENIEFSLAP